MSNLIERQSAIDEWKNDFKGYVNALNIPRDDYNGIMEYIDELPFAEPERKTGKWMIIDPQRQEDIDNDNYMYTCTCCLHNDLHARSQVVPYCWWCGAKMEVEK